MEANHTTIKFIIKDEPILSMLQNEFSKYEFELEFSPGPDNYKTITLDINKIVKFDSENNIVLEGYKVQAEDYKYYYKVERKPYESQLNYQLRALKHLNIE